MPTANTIAWSNQKLDPAIYPELARTIDVVLVPAGAGLTVKIAKGTVMAIQTSTGKWLPYDDDGTDDGRRVARGILPYDVIVDENSKVTYSTTTGQAVGEFSQPGVQNVPMYIAGYFNTADLTGLDANGAADLGRLVVGDSTTGLLAVR
jgi:hypothetical protein